ncbi:MAG TPA: FAD-dependent oxidoreductase [Burkholderiaceae bacterium]|nr:FAD-dependent oxidoreductase [Burkholderiaceae bacterium]
MKIAVVGAGIAGLGALHRLAEQLNDQAVTFSLFEKQSWLGGHTHTVDVTLDGVTHGVDTGFLVFNRRTYPNLVALFERLDVPVAETDMSFSVSVYEGSRELEWAGTNLDTVFAQRRNLVSPRFLRMLRDILRFNREATAIALANVESDETLGEFLSRRGYSNALRDWYLLPMAGAIWSCPTKTMLGFPMLTFARFCHNHALLQVEGRPKWATVRGGARGYVQRLLAATPNVRQRPGATRIHPEANGVRVAMADGSSELFDYAVVCTHTDEALALLDRPTVNEQSILGAISYQSNKAVLHTDARVLPRRRSTWSSWNYVSTGEGGDTASVAVNYLINQLQPVPFKQPVIVSLNPVQAIDARQVLGEYDYMHPVIDRGAVAAQARLSTIQGARRLWFAGAWAGYGFHEDGLKAGYAAADGVLAAIARDRATTFNARAA